MSVNDNEIKPGPGRLTAISQFGLMEGQGCVFRMPEGGIVPTPALPRIPLNQSSTRTYEFSEVPRFPRLARWFPFLGRFNRKLGKMVKTI